MSLSSASHHRLERLLQEIPESEGNRIMESSMNEAEPFTVLHMDPQSSSRIQTSSMRRRRDRRTSSRMERALQSWKKLLDEVVLVTIPELRQEVNRREIISSSERIRMDAVDGFLSPEAEPLEEISYNCRPPPVFIPLVSIAQICVFIFYSVRLNDIGFSRCCIDFESPLIYDPRRRQEAWRFLSYSFLHNGVFHLMTNILLQITLGIILELQHKLWRVLPVYIIGIVSGSLSSSICDPYVYLAGASGGVYALLGGHIATVILNWQEMQYNWTKSFLNVLKSGVCRLVIVFIIIFGDTVMAIYNRYASNIDPSKRVSYAAHFGSLIAGILVGVFFLRNLEMRRWKKIICAISISILAILLAGATVFNFICPIYKLCPDVLAVS